MGKAKFKVGDKVRVTVGDYKGLEAIVIKVIDDWDQRYRLEVTNYGTGWGWEKGGEVVFQETRIELIKGSRKVGEPIDPKDVIVGDTIRLDYEKDAYGQTAVYTAEVVEVQRETETRLYSKGTSRGLFYSTTWGKTTLTLVKAGPDPKAELLKKLKDSKSGQVVTFGNRTARKRNYLSLSIWDVFEMETKGKKVTPEELADLLPLDAKFLAEPAA